MSANEVRGESALILADGTSLRLRPSFAALTRAEEELGPLFALVDRAADGKLSLAEMVTLFWHCLDNPPATMTRDVLGESVAAVGLAQVAPALRRLLGQILRGI